MCDNSDDIPEQHKGKRRANPANYKRNVIKRSRMMGREYENHAGCKIPSKSIGIDCRCKKKCLNGMISAENQLSVVSHFYNEYSSKDEQDIYLQGLIDVVDVKRRRPRNDSGKEGRQHSFVYHVMVGSERKEVCAAAFRSVFAVSEKRVRRLRALKVEGKSPVDKRGKHTSFTLHPDTKIKVQEHIESFPVNESHYTGKPVQYLSADLNVKIMYKLFIAKYPSTKISYSFYFNYFKDNFNLRFGQPQVDCCCVCEELKVKLKSLFLNDAAKRVAAAELAIHARRSRKFYNALKKEKEDEKNGHNKNVLSVACDNMQNIAMPKLPVQELSYLRQLTVNGFCIHNIKTNKAVIFLYHEGQATKGPEEVCSFILHYLSSIPDQYDEIHLYSDNCSGQNKNHAFSKFLLSLTDSKKFKKIEHFFPVRGHSFLDCDRDFATIKMCLCKHDRIYTIHQLTELIISSSNTLKFTVIEVSPTSPVIYNLKKWWQAFYKKNPVSVETASCKDREKKVYFAISSFHHFIYDQQHPGTVSARQFINGLVEYTFILRHSSNTIHISKSKAYSEEKIPLKEEKVKDLKKILPYIDVNYRHMYEDIIN